MLTSKAQRGTVAPFKSLGTYSQQVTRDFLAIVAAGITPNCSHRRCALGFVVNQQRRWIDRADQETVPVQCVAQTANKQALNTCSEINGGRVTAPSTQTNVSKYGCGMSLTV